MKKLNLKLVDAALYMGDMAELDKSGLWTIREPNSPYGENGSEIFDCAIRHYSDDCNKFPIKHLGSFETFRRAEAYLNFLWSNGKTYDSLNEVEYFDAPKTYQFVLP